MTKSDEFRWRNSVQALYPHIKIGLSSLKPPFFSSLLESPSSPCLPTASTVGGIIAGRLDFVKSFDSVFAKFGNS